MPCFTMNWRQACSLMDAPHANDISAKMLRTPEAYGMAFEEVTIPATDGVKLSAWYIPAKDKNSKKLTLSLLVLTTLPAGSSQATPHHCRHC